MGFWPVVKRVVKDSDVVLEILDARMPDMSINEEVERLCKFHDRRFIRVFNKTDLISENEQKFLRRLYPEAFFVSGTKNIGLKKLKVEIMIYAKRIGVKEPSVGIVGYPNMGKSAIINALAHGARAKVSSTAGTTKGIQWIKAGSLRILDSPGVVPIRDKELKVGLLGSKNPEKMKRFDRIVYNLIKRFLERNKPALEQQYHIEILDADDEYEIILKIGKKRGFLLKGGIVDEHRTFLTIFRDWQSGKLRI